MTRITLTATCQRAVLMQSQSGRAAIRTVLLQLGEAVVTHSSRLVLQVLQVVLVGGARLTHHLLHTHTHSDVSAAMGRWH